MSTTYLNRGGIEAVLPLGKLPVRFFKSVRPPSLPSSLSSSLPRPSRSPSLPSFVLECHPLAIMAIGWKKKARRLWRSVGGNGKAQEWWENRVGKSAWLQRSVGMVRREIGRRTASGNAWLLCSVGGNGKAREWGENRVRKPLERLVGMVKRVVRRENGGRTVSGRMRGCSVQ